MERNIKMNNIQTVIFHIQGKRPEPAEAERLSALSFGSGLPGGAEIKDALKWFGIDDKRFDPEEYDLEYEQDILDDYWEFIQDITDKG